VGVCAVVSTRHGRMFGLDAVAASANNIVLDPMIRDWVFVPIVLVMFLQGVLRQYVAVLLNEEKKPVVSMIQKTLLLRRSARLRANAAFIPPAAFRMRKSYFVQRSFRPATEEPTPAATPDENATAAAAQNPMGDPFAMVGAMKQNMLMIVPNMVLMGWVSYFFSGFVIVKLPFGLSDRFKTMTQRGILLRTLDASYVSSLSWYFICLFGIRGLHSLILGENNASDSTRMMADQMSMNPGAMGPGGPQVDFDALYGAERTELEIESTSFCIPRAETRILRM